MQPRIYTASPFEIATTVGTTSQAFYLIFAVSAFFIVAITAVMIYFVFRYHRRRNPVATDVTGNPWLEAAWTLIPTALTLAMFYYGWAGFLAASQPGEGALEIIVEARMYNWRFKYPNGRIETELRVPSGRPIWLRLQSMDVIHSLFLPAFRIKEDAVPGQTGTLAFTALHEGVYDIFCAEYCGVGHAAMSSRVLVMPPKDFDLWYSAREAQKPLDLKAVMVASPAQLERGKAVYDNQCVSCHGAGGEGGLVAGARDFRKLDGWKNGGKVSQMYRTLNSGLGAGMPSFAHLPAEDRFAVIHYVRNFATGHATDTPEDAAALDQDFSISKGSEAPPEILIEEAMKKLAAESRAAGAATGPAATLDPAAFDALAASEPRGARLYQANCAACHGPRGDGGVSIAALDEVFRARLMALALTAPDRPWRRDVEAFRKRIVETSEATGGLKPSFATFSTEEWAEIFRFVTGLDSSRQ